MFRRLLPSPAMVVAVTALFLSLGGSAYALVVTGKQIRNNTVTGEGHPQPLAHRQGRPQGQARRRVDQGAALGTGGTVALVAYGGARFAVVNGPGTAGSRPGRQLGGPHRRRPLPGDLQRGRTRLRLLRDGRRHERRPPRPGTQVTLASLATHVNGVRGPDRERGNGSEADRPFHLIVMC